MSYRSIDSALITSLQNNDAHTYVHLIKFEKPSIDTEVAYKSGAKPSRKANTYSYLTDGGFAVSFDDGSVPSDGSAANGAQTYIPGKIISVGTVSETIEAKASTMSLQLAATVLSTSIVDTFTITSTTVAGSTDLLEAGFSVGDTVEFVNSSESNNGVYVRIDGFSNENKTFTYTTISGTITTESSVEYTLSFGSAEIIGPTQSKEAVDYSNYLNREVFIYRAHIDSLGAVIGEPFLIFKGIITGSSFDDNVLKAGKITWTLTSHWGDFVQVAGRITSDHAHRGLDVAGVPSEDAVIRPEYTGDLGFRHAEQAVNIVATYQVPETRYKMKRKGGLSGLFGGKRLVEYTEMVDRDVDLEFNLSSKYIPVIYGVQKATGIPIFADGDVDDPQKVYVAQAISEGPIHGVLDIHIDSNPVICINGADSNDRSAGDSAVLCVGRADRGDVLNGGSAVSTSNDITSQMLDEAEALVQEGAAEDMQEAIAIVQLMYGFNTQRETHSDGGAGILHEKKINLDSPLDTELQFHAGLDNQAANSFFTVKAGAKKFKVQSILYPDLAPNLYWGPSHQLLDTAYTTMNFTIAEGEFTIPDYEFVVKGRVLDCFNYDYSYSGNGTTHTNFKLGDMVTLHKTSDDTQLGSEEVQIIDKWSFYSAAGLLKYRFRFSKNLQLQDVRGDSAGDAKNFYMKSTDGNNNKWYFAAHDAVMEDIQATPEPISSENFLNLTSITSGIGITSYNQSTAYGNQLRYKLTGVPVNEDQFRSSGGFVAFDFVYSDGAKETVRFPYESYTGSQIFFPVSLNYTLSQAQIKLANSASYIMYAPEAVRLSSTSSTTDDEYNGLLIEITKIDTSTGDVLQKLERVISDYDGSTKIAFLDSALTFRTNSTDAFKYTLLGDPEVVEVQDLFPAFQDKRVSTNPAIQLLDYLTNKRYGKGLDIDTDIDLPSFLSVARACDEQSKVTILTTDSAPTVGDKYRYPATGDLVFQGTVDSVKQVSYNSLTFQEVTFKDVIGKLIYKWSDYRAFKPNEVLYYEGTAFTTNISSAQGQIVNASTRDSFISSNALNDTSNLFTLGKVGDETNTTLDIFLDSGDAYGTASTNPAVRRSSPTGFDRTGYSLYDSDDCKYWVYLGWDEPEQRYVTRHQTNLTVDTAQSVFANINAMLEQFGGMLRYSNGKYSLAIKAGAPADAHFITDFPSKDISEGEIIGGVKVQDSGSRKTFNSLNATIVDPANKFGGRSITFMNSQYLKQDRGIKKQGNYNIPGISNYFNARMNIKQQLDESRYGLTIKFTIDQKGYLLLAGDIIRLTYSRFGWSNKYFRINSLNFQANGLVQVVADEHNDNAYIIDHLESSRGATGLEGGGQGTFVPSVPGQPTTSTSPSQDKTGYIELNWTNGGNFNPQIHRTEIARAPEANSVSAPNSDLSNVKIIAEVQTNSFLDNNHERTTSGNDAQPTKYDYWVRHRYNTTGTTGTTNRLNQATPWTYLGEGHALPTAQTEIEDGVTVGDGGVTFEGSGSTGAHIKSSGTGFSSGNDGFYLGWDDSGTPAHKFFVGDRDGSKLSFDGTDLSLEGGEFTVTDSGGTAPSISGTTLAGAGILLKDDGDVLFGDSASNYVFFDESEGDLTVKGDVTATSLTLTDGATVGNLNASSIEGVTQASFTSIGATAYNPEINGSRVTWTIPANDSGNNWAHKLVSDYGFIGGALVSFKINKDNTTNSRYMVGLSDDTTGNSYSIIDYAIFVNSNTDVRAYENGNNAQQLKSSVVAGDVCTITYDGTKVRYYINKTVVRTVTVSSAFSGPLYAHVALDNDATASVEHRIDNLEFGAHASVKQQVEDQVTVSSGGITLDTSAAIKSGQTAFDTGTGFFLGADSSTPKFSIGDSTASKLTWDGTDLAVTGKIISGSIQGNHTNAVPDDVFTRTTNPNVLTGNETGAFIDLENGELIIGNANSFMSFAGNPDNNDEKELDVKGVLSATKLDFADTEATTLPTHIKASAVSDGSIGPDAFTQEVWSQIDSRQGTGSGGFYASTSGNYLGEATKYIELAPTPALDHGAENVTLEAIMTDSFTYPINYSYGSTNTQVTVSFEAREDGTSTWSTVGTSAVFSANPTLLQYATNYTVDDTHTVTLTTGTASQVTNGDRDLVNDTDYDFRLKIVRNNASSVFLPSSSGGANDSTGTPVTLEAVEQSTGGVVSGNLVTEATLSHKDDTDTYIEFTDDQIDFYAGNVHFATFEEDTTDSITLRQDTTIIGDLKLGDARRIELGDDTDLKIVHNGGTGTIENDTGNLFIKNREEDGDIYFQSDNGNNGTTTYFYLDGSEENVKFNKDVVISGDLTVSGSTTTVNTNDLTVADKEITLNYHASNDTSSTADGAGITIQDAVNGSTDASILWNAANDRFNFSHGIGLAAGELIKDTGDSGNSINLNDDTTSHGINALTLSSISGINFLLDINDNDSQVFNFLVHASTPDTATQVAKITDDGSAVFGGTVTSDDGFVGRGGDSATSGQLLNLHGTSLNQTHSGTIRLTEGHYASSPFFQGAYMTYDGNNNAFRVGTHDQSNQTLSDDVEAFYISRGSNDVYFQGDVSIRDNERLTLGTDDDVLFYHTGSTGFLKNTNGHLYIDQEGGTDIYFRGDDGSGGVETYFFIDSSSQFTKFQRPVRFDMTDQNLTNGVYIDSDNNTSDSNYRAMTIDLDVTGSDTVTAGTDRDKMGLYIDLDSSASGGDTTDEVRLYGIYADVRNNAAGTADRVDGAFFYARSSHTHSGTVTNVRGAYANAYSNPTTGSVTTMMGMYGYASNAASGTGTVTSTWGVYGTGLTTHTTSVAQSNVGGGYFIGQLGTTTGTTTNLYGVRAEVQLDNTTNTRTVSNAYVVQALYDENIGATNNTTVTNGFLFYGYYDGNELPTNAYGIYIADDVESRFIGKVRTNNAFDVNGTTVINSSRTHFATAGSAQNPGYTFDTDTNTGIYRYTGGSEDRLGISTNGALRANFGSHGIESSANVYTGTGASFRNYGGTWNASTGLTGNGFIFQNTADSTTALSLTADGDATFLGKIKSKGRQEYSDAYTVKVTKTYNGALSSLEYQKLLSIVPSGDSHNYEIAGTITAQSSADVQVIDLHVALRSQTLPDLVWQAYYDEKHHGTRLIDPLLWTKETSPAEFILAYQVLSGVTIYGTVTIDLEVRHRNSDDTSDITVSTASDQTAVDTGFTSNAITKVKEVSDDTVTFTGDVGIGTTSPSDPLHVVGDIRSTTRILTGDGTEVKPSFQFVNSVNTGMYRPAADEIGFVNNSSESVRIDASGNVGIGETDPVSPLHINALSDTNYYTVTRSNGLTVVGANRDLDTDSAGNIDIIGTSRSSAVGGNVGKGPSITFSQNVSEFVDGYEQVIGGIKTELLGTDTNTHANSAMRFYTSTGIGASTSLNERMAILNDGSVGIGTVNPNLRLIVNSGTVDHVAQFVSTDNKAGISIKDNDTTVYLSAENAVGSFGFNLGANANNLNIRSNGNVGIGLSSSDVKLEVRDNTGTLGTTQDIIARFRRNDGTYNPRLEIRASTSGTDINHTYSTISQDLTFSIAGDEKLRVAHDGYIGINEANPAFSIHSTQDLTSSPANIIYLQASGTNVNGGGGALRFDTSATNATTSQYYASIEGVRTDTSDGSNELRFFTTDASVTGTPAQRMVIDELGAVGINTGSPLAGYKLDVEGGIFATNGLFGTRNSDRIRIFNRATNDVAVESFSAELFLSSGYNGISFEGSANTTLMKMDDTGNFGIGETNPAHKLEVSGDGHLIRATGTTSGGSARIGVYNENDGSGNAGALVYMESSGWGEGYVYVGSHYLSAAGGDFNFRAGTSADLTLGNGTTEYARISGAGNFGIGTGFGSSAPASQLHVRMPNISGGNNGNGITVSDDGSDLKLEIRKGTGGVAGNRRISLYEDGGNFPLYLQEEGGNVGIGAFLTTQPNANSNTNLTPASPLHIFKYAGNTETATLLTLETYRGDYAADPGKIAIDFKGQDSNNNENFARIAQATVNDSDYGDNNEATSNLIFGMTKNGTYNERMILTGAGRLGLGTLNPAAPLHITDTGAGADTVRIESTNSGTGQAQSFGPALALVRTQTSEADGDKLGALRFFGQNSSNVSYEYAKIETTSDDVTDGTEDGGLNFYISEAGSLVEKGSFNPYGLFVNTTSVLDTTAQLQIKGNTGGYARITMEDADNIYQKSYITQSGGVTQITTQLSNTEHGTFKIATYNGTNTIDRVIVDGNGDVGIGISPGASSKLRVAGNISTSTGSISAFGNLVAGGKVEAGSASSTLGYWLGSTQIIDGNGKITNLDAKSHTSLEKPSFDGTNSGSYIYSADHNYVSNIPDHDNWHDVFSFRRFYTWTHETSTDGSSFSSATISDVPFDQKDSTAYTLLNSTIKAARWTINGINYADLKYLGVGINYSPSAPTVKVKVETSSDGSTWSVLGGSTVSGDVGNTTLSASAISYLVRLGESGLSGNLPYLRITITKETISDTNDWDLAFLRAWSNRPGDQGKGKEYMLPYDYHERQYIRLTDNQELKLGASDDLRIYHYQPTGGGTSSNYITAETGTLYVRTGANDNDVVIQSDNGSGGLADYFRADGSDGTANLYHLGSLRLNTISNGIRVRSDSFARIQLSDTDATGLHAYVDKSGGDLNLTSQNNTNFGAVTLRRYNGSTTVNSLRAESSGDIKFYEDTGTSVKVRWDATNQRLGINTDSPEAQLHVVSGNSVGDAVIIIEADDDNNVENDNPMLEFRQDGNLVSGYMYLEGNTNQTATGTVANSLVIDSKANTGGSNIHFVTGGISPEQPGGPTSGTVRMTVAAGGGVGIGVSAPESRLHVANGNSGIATQYSTAMIEAGDAQLDIVSSPAGSWGSAINFVEGTDSTANTNIWSIARQTSGTVSGSTGDKTLRFNFGTGNNHENATQVVFENTSLGTNVGIGTSNPDTNLHVVGDVKATSQFYAGSGTVIKPSFGFSDSSTTGIYRPAADEISFTNAGSDSVRIDADGKVGINVTDPDARLHIDDTTTIGWSNLSGAYLLLGTTTAGIGIDQNEFMCKGSDLYFGASGTGADIIFRAGTSSDTKMIINGTTSKVGIGNLSNPAELLHITGGRVRIDFNGGHTSGNVGPSNATLDLYNNLAADTNEKGSIITFSDNYSGGGTFNKTTRAAIKGGTDTTGNTADGFLAFYTDASSANSMAERMRIDHDGKVGIGTDTPPQLLSVKGTATVLGSTGIQVASILRESDAGKIQLTDSGGNLKVTLRGSGSSYIFGGDFGIGTQSPTHRLHVVDSAGSYSGGDQPIAVIQAATDHRHLLKVKNTNTNATASAPRAGIDLDVENHEDDTRARAILDVRTRSSLGNGGDTNLTTPFDFSIYTNNHDTITVSEGAQASSSVPGGTLALHIDENQHVGVGTSSTTHNFTSDVGAVGSNTYAGHFIGSLVYTPPNSGTFNQISNGVLIQAGGFNAAGTSYALMVQARDSTELFAVNGNTGAVRFHDAFTFPTTDGGPNQVLKTNGNGTVSWADQSGGATLSNGVDNRVVTASGANSLNGEANMTFDGSLLTVTGNIKIAGSDPILKRDQYDYLDFDDDSQTYTGGTNATVLASISDVAIRTNTNDGGGGAFTVVSGASSPTTMLSITGSGDATFSGSVSATTKSFDIKHPTKEGMRLHHGSLEGPEHGVYVRGHATENVIELPEYWTGLVDEKTITVQLTANGRFQKLYVEKVENNKVYLRNASWFSNKIDCYYMINATRKDIEQFEVEYGNA